MFSDMMENLKLNASLDVDYVDYSVFYLYPGIKLFEECKEKNLFSEKTIDSYFDSTVLNFWRLQKKY
jgi:hypothetical protein